jgi:3-deoxy-D-manno-octulosonate 8-phosphate phosphatase (KDO 8-P phosphatase)
MGKFLVQTIVEKARQIRLVIFDVDGILTDGSLYFGVEGGEYKVFNARDGMGMVLLQMSGVAIAIITGLTSHAVTQRMESLGIHHVFQGQRNKLEAFHQLCEKLQLTPQQVAYVGDDVNDVPVMSQVGLAITVADAHPWAVKYAHWQTQAAGGHGAAREICDFIMQAQGTFVEQLSHYGIVT